MLWEDIGNYRKSAARYIRAELKSGSKIKRNRLFITHAGCTASDIKMVKKYVSSFMKFDEVVATNASATISSNCGPKTFGLIYITAKHIPRL